MTVDTEDLRVLEKELRGWVARRAQALSEFERHPSELGLRDVLKELASLGYASLSTDGTTPGIDANGELAPTVVGELALGSPSTATLLLTHYYAEALMGTEATLPAASPLAGSWLAACPYQSPAEGEPTLALPSGPAGPLMGTASLVVGASVADRLVLLAEDPASSQVVVVVDTRCSEVSEPVATLGLRGAVAADVRLERAPGDGFRVLGSTTNGAGHVERARFALTKMAGRLVQSLLKEATRLAREHARARVQGGRCIIEHPQVMELLDRLELATTLTNAAARNPDETGSTGDALRLVGRSARRGAEAAMQVFGGSGYMDDAPIGQLYRDILQASALGG